MERGEDAENKATLAAAKAREEALGEARARAGDLPLPLVKRLLLGERPLRIWREHRGIAARDLAVSAGLQPGSLDAMLRLARALDLPVEDLAVPIATELVFDDRFHAESGNCYLWADEPTFGRVRFLLSGAVMSDVLKAGNPVNNRRIEEVAKRKRRRIEVACRRAFARRKSNRVVVLV